ncbi:hypothetical protein [Amylibacter sp. IMCC11727]|uniref:hypothetical protein n=1 Tax=Amylibacter sp. IMCC11727 TaxID=3039851 RepID=UPI00244E1530|nr:hypothetical protein [Amylibacter sp. IMCC11727]WGI20885.1 hypothetical protein QBD29_12285 [Amylibacter sp. IMCC11727]
MFWKSEFISEDLALWVFDNYAWAIDHHNPRYWLNPDSLVRPTKQYFKAKGGGDHASALGVFNDIKRLLGMSKKRIALEPIPQLPENIGHEYGQTSMIAGQYFPDEFNPLITYNPRIMRQPINFIATLAHELMHAKLDPVADQLPGGWDAHELATDLHCIIHGFGLIQLQGAADAGWAGYMTQPTRAFATAIFAKLTGSEAHIAAALTGREAKLMKKAFKALKDWDEEFCALRAKL